MGGFVDSTVQDIDGRLEELRDEAIRLEAARDALLGGHRGPGRPRATGTSTSTTSTAKKGARRRPGRPRGRRGGNTRSNQALELVRNEPGITIPQIAEALQIEPNYLYRVMPKLVGEGLIAREGQGWHPAGGQEAAAAE